MKTEVTLAIKDLPNDLIDALIATEDIRFRNHSGIDIRSLVKSRIRPNYW